MNQTVNAIWGRTKDNSLFPLPLCLFPNSLALFRRLFLPRFEIPLKLPPIPIKKSFNDP